MESKSIEEASYHAWFHHGNTDGYITMAKKESDGAFRQYHYKPNEMAAELTNWLGEDVYFSQNTFYKPFRRIENIRKLQALYVDVDAYLFNYAPEWVLGKLELEVFDQQIPEPNLIIFSGRGIVCVWLIEPVPHKALPLWQAIQNYFCEQLQGVGGDTKALDAARVFRIAGSVNSKSGEYVRAQYRHDYRYPLRDIQYDYLPELEPKKKKGRPSKPAQLFNTYRLHHARLLDLTKLVELREYAVEGYRETLCFLYRYWSCCVLSDSKEALRQTLEFNSEFRSPLPEKEVTKATKSAEKAWNAKNNKEANEEAIKHGYPGAGYNLKNSKIINWLDITPEEQRHLSTVMDGEEKKRRKREANKEMRREKGMKTMQEYNDIRKEQTEEKLKVVQQALETHPNASIRKLAHYTGFSKTTVQRLLKQIK
ncbi:replication protein [Pontibacillus salipaludis]|uniref:Replication protein n=1 Tax=Pontibacillus salipaludis TaxID=1697394 RepID=A0ABQ1QJY1_9BACI|nr:replication protein [Pontibacillus salipaludis]GGD29094.1 hypothetical protein GCM10011389_40830 [Pontibacillus salipaludis]